MARLNPRILFFFLIVLTAALTRVLVPTLSSSERLLVWSDFLPGSPDPREFDVSTNHFGYGPVFIKLFSSYRNATVSGQLAKSWKMENGGSTWKIKVRSDLTFSNGEKITAESAVRSIVRILYFSKKAKSSLPLLSKIKGVDSLLAFDSKISGISAIEDEITIDLNSPEPNLPETLSFGLYGVVNSANLDPKTGEWRNEEKVIASGPYAIGAAQPGSFLLQKRKNFPADLSSQRAYSEILITNDSALRNQADIVDGFQEDQPKGAFHFHGNTSADIFYLHIFKWKSGNWSDKEFRTNLRERFYFELDKLGFKPVRSFFPLIFPGISEVTKQGVSVENYSKPGLKFEYKEPSNTKIPKFKAIGDALKAVAEVGEFEFKIGKPVPFDEFRKFLRGKKTESIDYEIGARITSMGNEDPRETFKFMLSKEGIFLPDPGKRLSQLVKDPAFSLQKANGIIQEEAVIWPVYHFSMGFWATSKLDFSEYNSEWPLSELQWIGAK